MPCWKVELEFVICGFNSFCFCTSRYSFVLLCSWALPGLEFDGVVLDASLVAEVVIVLLWPAARMARRERRATDIFVVVNMVL